jgi:hypothetical protein
VIFPVLELENKIQVDDKTRLSAIKTYVTPEEAAISLLEIEPFAGAGFLDVTNAKYLDYQYSMGGDVQVTLRVTTDGAPESITKNITVISAADDRLFSSDADLVPHEPDVLSYVRDGRNSFLDVHRTAQEHILAWLDEHGLRQADGTLFTAVNIHNLEEVKRWSKFLTLRLIFEGLSNSVDDIFAQKSERYRILEAEARNRVNITLDVDGDGNADTRPELRTGMLRRR